jgi:hypothetical protein
MQFELIFSKTVCLRGGGKEEDEAGKQLAIEEELAWFNAQMEALEKAAEENAKESEDEKAGGGK